MAGRSGRLAVIIKLQFSYACSYLYNNTGCDDYLVDSIKIDFILCVETDTKNAMNSQIVQKVST